MEPVTTATATTTTTTIPIDELVTATKDAPAEDFVRLARAAAAKVAMRIVPEDRASERDDRARALLVALMARNARRAALAFTGVGRATGPVRIAQAIQLVKACMAFMQKYPGLSGDEKKDAVVDAVMNTVAQFNPGMEAAERGSLAEMVDAAIELGIDAKNGKLDPVDAVLLATDAAVHSAAFGGCLPCFK